MNDLLKKLAPTVASALLGPLGGLAVSALGDIFGVSQPTKEKLAEALSGTGLTPEQVSKLKELELQYQNDEKERGFKYAELEVKDRQGARERDAGITAAGRINFRAHIMFALAVAVIVWLVWMIWKDPSVNEFMKGIVTLVLGRFLGYLDSIYNFEFGTTRGSQTKDATIASLSNKGGPGA